MEIAYVKRAGMHVAPRSTHDSFIVDVYIVRIRKINKKKTLFIFISEMCVCFWTIMSLFASMHLIVCVLLVFVFVWISFNGLLEKVLSCLYGVYRSFCRFYSSYLCAVCVFFFLLIWSFFRGYHYDVHRRGAICIFTWIEMWICLLDHDYRLV